MTYRRIFNVDPYWLDGRAQVSRGVTTESGVEVIVTADVLRMDTVIRTAAFRGSYDQRTNGRLRHV